MFKVGDIIQTLAGPAIITNVSDYSEICNVLWVGGWAAQVLFEDVDKNIRADSWKKIGETTILQALYDVMNSKEALKKLSVKLDIESH